VRQRVARFDVAADRALDHLRGRPAADRVFYAASELGDFSLLWLLIAAARGLRSERSWHVATRLGFGICVESVLVNAVLKTAFRRKRPVWDGVRPHRLRRPLTSSFPSGHATSAVACAILLSDDDPLWPFYAALAAVVATSRVYVKIHHASDVAAGAALGAVLGVLGRRFLPLPSADGGPGD
jgi:undecaprenyl-diphosphatase